MLRPIRPLKRTPKIRFVAQRFIFFAISILGSIATIALLATAGLNFGIDFRGGILIEVRTPAAADLGAMRTSLGDLGLGEVALQGFGDERDVLVRVQRQEGGDEAQQQAVARIKEALTTDLGTGVEFRRIEVVGPQVSGELIEASAIALTVAVIGIVIYIWVRFEWQFGVGAVLALVHDVLLTLGLFTLFEIEFNLTIVAALLTIVGYSINDTVVIYDRVRENLRKYKQMSLPDLIDLSVNETLSRTIMTGGTALLALLSLNIFGGEVIAGFTLAMLWGIVVGTYSSVYIAAPVLLYTGVRRGGPGPAEDAGTTPAPAS
jgi:preprotein translocase subunit SecF